MYELNDLRTRGVETWVQAQKVEKEVSDEEARHKKETEKAKKDEKTNEMTLLQSLPTAAQAALDNASSVQLLVSSVQLLAERGPSFP